MNRVRFCMAVNSELATCEKYFHPDKHKILYQQLA